MNKSGTLTYRIAKKAPVGTHGAGSHAWAGRSCHTWGYLPKKLHSCTAGWLLLLLQSINGILKKSHMPTFVITKSDVMGIPVEIFECFLISSSFRPPKKSPSNCTQSIRPIHRQTTPRVDAVNKRRCGPLRSSKRTQQRDTRRECRNNFLPKRINDWKIRF